MTAKTKKHALDSLNMTSMRCHTLYLETRAITGKKISSDLVLVKS